MKMSDFSREEQAEIAKAVIEASVDFEGRAVPMDEALTTFDRFVADAVQAHREWAHRLLDGFRIDGERRFIKEVQKSEQFQLWHKGKSRRRSLRRGTRVQQEDGSRKWVQDSLLTFTAEQLERAITEAVRRIEEERANIAMYRALLDLLQETGAQFVGDALAQVGKTLEEFLADRDAA